MEVFVTNRCNMACANCCVDTSKHSDGSERLDWSDLRSAIDLFMDPERTPYRGQKTILFAGGETLFEYPLIKKAVDYAQKFPLPPHFEIYTNGTVIRPEWLQELRRWDATVIFSLDGGKEGHDAARKFSRAPGLSAYDEVVERISALPKDNCATNTVIRPENIEGLVDALDDYSKMGFRQIDMWLDYLHVWTPEQIDALQVFVDDFRRYYVHRTEKEGDIPFVVPMIHHALYNGSEMARGRAWWRDCFRLVLGADGHFYDCEGALLKPYGEVRDAHSIGKASNGGPDWGARQKVMDLAAEKLKNLDTDKNWQYVCPRLYCTAMGLSGAEPDDAVANLHRASEVFLLAFVKIAKDLKDNESFKKTYLSKVMDTPG
jgi:sulfatase maturation enzyme AslB (radical SAM superfamily)